MAYSLDRTILGAFRSTAAVGLSKGPIGAQPHPSTPRDARGHGPTGVEPIAGRTRCGADTRPPAAGHALHARRGRPLDRRDGPREAVLVRWIGPKFSVAATAMTLLAALALQREHRVPGTMLWRRQRSPAHGVRRLGRRAERRAFLALTPSLGLNGVVLGTMISNIAGFPFFMAMMLPAFPVKLAEFAREDWLPAYATGAVLDAALLVVRASVHLGSLPLVTGVGLLAVLGYWTIITWPGCGRRSARW